MRDLLFYNLSLFLFSYTKCALSVAHLTAKENIFCGRSTNFPFYKLMRFSYVMNLKQQSIKILVRLLKKIQRRNSFRIRMMDLVNKRKSSVLLRDYPLMFHKRYIKNCFCTRRFEKMKIISQTNFF